MNTENIYSVYVHKNLKNDKYYVGCTSKNPSYRWNNGKGYQNNSKMWEDIQESDWKTDWLHGILGKFEDKDEALKYEAFLIAMLDSVRNGYNTSSYGNSHFKHSEEYKKKMSEALTGENNPMFGMTGKNSPNFGKHHSEETRKKISEAQTGEKNHMFGMTGEKHPNFGKHHSEETKKKIRENTPSKAVIQYTMNGEFIAEYPSTREASRQIGCHCQSICACCKGKYKSCGGYIWKYKEG